MREIPPPRREAFRRSGFKSRKSSVFTWWAILTLLGSNDPRLPTRAGHATAHCRDSTLPRQHSAATAWPCLQAKQWWIIALCLYSVWLFHLDIKALKLYFFLSLVLYSVVAKIKNCRVPSSAPRPHCFMFLLSWVPGNLDETYCTQPDILCHKYACSILVY